MTKLEDDSSHRSSSTTGATVSTRGGKPHDDNGLVDILQDSPDTPSYTDNIAAITVAVLAVVLLLTLLIVFRALRKRLRARQGQRLDDLPTISAGIMGAGVSAYNNIPIAGRVTWEPVSETSTAVPSTSRGDHSSPDRADRHQRRGHRNRDRDSLSSQARS